MKPKLVHSFAELFSTPFADGINALCWLRKLQGDFAEIVAKLTVGPGINTVTDEQLEALVLSSAGQLARAALLEDQRCLRAHGLAPVLDCIDGYLRDESDAIVPTDVCSFHVDSAPVEADTWLCTYQGACSEGLPNDQARRRVDVPETRAQLLQLYRSESGGGSADDADFHDWLAENFFDLHYAPNPDARPYGFGLHNLWRIACQYPGAPVPPCIHRAPETHPGDPKRLLLIS